MWGGAGGRQRQNEGLLGEWVTSLYMFIGNSADDKKTCICMGDSRANVGGELEGGSDKMKLW